MKKKESIPFRPAAGPLYNAAREKEGNIAGLRIREARRRLGLSLAELSGRLRLLGADVSENSAGKWELGYSVPNVYQFIALCRALELDDPLSFFTEDHSPPLNEEGMQLLSRYRADLIASGNYRPVPAPEAPDNLVEFPVSELAVSAGPGAFLDEGHTELVSFPADRIPRGADLGIRVRGDSMEPVYHDGQIIFIRLCDRVEPGQVGVFVCDGEGFLKVYSERDPEESLLEEYTDSYGTVHRQPVLVSYNKKYDPRAIRPSEQFEVVGRVL